jgi:hypothetical protein
LNLSGPLVRTLGGESRHLARGWTTPEVATADCPHRAVSLPWGIPQTAFKKG